MKKYMVLTAFTATLAGCTGIADPTASFSDGSDTSFLQQGTTSCPGVIESGNPIYERYPLRCGPQAQVIPR